MAKITGGAAAAGERIPENASEPNRAAAGEPSIVLDGLCKTYDSGLQAVKNVSLELYRGEVFGFLGPNGAGKTTTVKLMTAMLAPTSGRCLIMGRDPVTEPDEVHAVSGVVTEHAMMYDNLSGLDNLKFYAATFGLGPAEAKTRAENLLHVLGLADAAEQKLASYSTGMRQRLSLARALIHRPSVLFLDEPSSGLDPESALNVNAMIRRLADEEDVTVFLCTHQLRYAQEICTRFGLLSEGRLLALGSLDELRSAILPASLLKIETSQRVIEEKITGREAIPAIVRALVDAGESIYSVQTIEPTLEDVYFALTNAEGKHAD